MQNKYSYLNTMPITNNTQGGSNRIFKRIQTKSFLSFIVSSGIKEWISHQTSPQLHKATKVYVRLMFLRIGKFNTRTH
jgi:hypothetical protein